MVNMACCTLAEDGSHCLQERSCCRWVKLFIFLLLICEEGNYDRNFKLWLRTQCYLGRVGNVPLFNRISTHLKITHLGWPAEKNGTVSWRKTQERHLCVLRGHTLSGKTAISRLRNYISNDYVKTIRELIKRDQLIKVVDVIQRQQGYQSQNITAMLSRKTFSAIHPKWWE